RGKKVVDFSVARRSSVLSSRQAVNADSRLPVADGSRKLRQLEKPRANSNWLGAYFHESRSLRAREVLAQGLCRKCACSHGTKVVPPASLLHFRVDNTHSGRKIAAIRIPPQQMLYLPQAGWGRQGILPRRDDEQS